MWAALEYMGTRQKMSEYVTYVAAEARGDAVHSCSAMMRARIYRQHDLVYN